MPQSLLWIIIPLGFVIVFPLFWMGLVSLVARFGGWKKLAAYYGADDPASGEVFRWASLHIGSFTRYKNSLTVTVSSRGIHLKPIMIFRTGHEPLFIPWDAVLEMEKQQFWKISSVRLTVEGVDGSKPTILTFHHKGLTDSLGRQAPMHLIGE